MSATEKRKARVNRANKIKAAKNMPTALLLKKKVECDAKALQIVQKLMEPAVDVKWMFEALGQINRTHLEDVADERAIGKLCGYILCDNELTKVINKKYHISTLKNKVYDVEKMKNFCSFTCYSAMNHLMIQMLTSPLWLRDAEEIPTFTLLDNSKKRARSPPGVEINITGIDLLDIDDLSKRKESKSDTCDDSVEKNNTITTQRKPHKVETISPRNQSNTSSSRSTNQQTLTKKGSDITETFVENDDTINLPNENKCTEELPKKDHFSASSKLDHSTKNYDIVHTKNDSTAVSGTEKINTISERITSTVHNQYANSESPKTTVEKIASNKKIEKKSIIQKPVIFTETLATRLEKCFNEWVTEDTHNFINGKKTDKNSMIEKTEFNDKYTALCKRVDQLQFEDDDDEQETSTSSENLKPAPHYAVLKEQAKELEIKVRAFYGGQLESEILVDNSNEKESDKEPSTVVPLTDAHAPNALRRRIFLDKLNKILPDVFRTLTGPNQTEYFYTTKRISLVKTLISTFNLTAKNIVFRTTEWTLVSLLIIKMLGLVDFKIKTLLSKKDTTLYLSMILMSYQLDLNYVNSLMNRFTISSEVNDMNDFK